MRRTSICTKFLRAAIAATLAFSCAAFLNGCFVSNATLANTQTIDLSGIKSLSISYPTENITFFASDSDQLVLKEYISESDSSYFAQIDENDTSASIVCGQRPDDSRPFSSYVEVYIPTSWEGSLRVTTSSGMVTIKPHLRLKSATVNTASGAISITDVSARQITLSTDTGRIDVSKAEGEMLCSSSSGSIEVDSLSGQGSFSTSSGRVAVSMLSTTGDVSIATTSGKASISLPKSLSFNYEATSTSGHATTNFDDQVQTSTVVSAAAADFGSKTVYTAAVGTAPDIYVKISTTSGTISASLVK